MDKREAEEILARFFFAAQNVRGISGYELLEYLKTRVGKDVLLAALDAHVCRGCGCGLPDICLDCMDKPVRMPPLSSKRYRMILVEED